jgi:hypothetical protein
MVAPHQPAADVGGLGQIGIAKNHLILRPCGERLQRQIIVGLEQRFEDIGFQDDGALMVGAHGEAFAQPHAVDGRFIPQRPARHLDRLPNEILIQHAFRFAKGKGGDVGFRVGRAARAWAPWR